MSRISTIRHVPTLKSKGFSGAIFGGQTRMTCRYAAEGKYLDFNTDKQKSRDPRLSVTDSARRAGVTIGQVNQWLDDGEIEPSHVTCGRRYVRQSDLDRFLAGRVDG